MCGIAGIVGRGWTLAMLEGMVAAQNHRGPDDHGIYIDDSGMIGLGHNRLSIIDLSPAGHQPMANYNNTLWIVFNGEVYNYLELQTELGDYPYHSKSDTEVILAAYDRWGESCVEHFIGMFSFTIWDIPRQRLFCARDRLGIKPFHYALYNGLFLFASEIKAILAVGHPSGPNWNMWAVYLTHGIYDHSAETFFKDIHGLPPGHTLTFENGQVLIRPYWDLPTQAVETLEMSDDQAAQRLREMFTDAVRLRLRSDVPLGVNLSGGLDSASMMVTMDRLLQDVGEIQTFTASFADPQYDEQEFASQVSRQTRWARHVQRLDQSDVWDIAWQALWHQEAPFGGIATLSYHHLHRLARERGVTVLLEGQGVDEMLAGYNYFRPLFYQDLLEQGQWSRLRSELRAATANGILGLEFMRRIPQDSAFNIYQDGTSFLRPDCIYPDVREMAGQQPEFPQPFQEHLTNGLYRDLRYTKLPRVLRMNDRLSMAFGCELRVPYLDHRVVEFLFRLPGHQKIHSGQSKYLLRHAMREILPDSVRQASKRAVVTPQREWLRTDLRPHVEEIIHSRSFAERGIFDASEVKLAYKQFCDGEGQNAFFVWQWVNTELWFRRFIDERPHA